MPTETGLSPRSGAARRHGYTSAGATGGTGGSAAAATSGLTCVRAGYCADGYCASRSWEGHSLCGALIVHPRFRHTLANPPVPADPPRRACWADLPGEVLEMIAGHLDKPQDLLRLSAVCRDARRLATSDALWKQLCRRQFGVPEQPWGSGTTAPPPPQRGFWLALFKYNHQIFMDMVRSTTGPTDFARGFGQGPVIIQLP